MHRVRQYERFSEEKRHSRRTVADAVEVLREAADFQEHDRANIKIGILRLSSGDAVGLVQLFFDSPFQEKVFIVSLPTSVQFRGRHPGSSQWDRFDILLLDGAAVDGAANFLLADGTALRAAEVIPARLPYEPSELDWRIVHHTISIIGAEGRCYRHFTDGLQPAFRGMVPDAKALDCSTFSGLTVPSLKVLAAGIAARDWTLKKLSHQKISDALSAFGIRHQRPRPRRSQ